MTVILICGKNVGCTETVVRIPERVSHLYMEVAIYTSVIDQSDSGPGVYRENLVRNLLAMDPPEIEFTLVHHETTSNEIYSKTNEIILPQPRKLAQVCNRILGLDSIPAQGYNPFIEQYLFAKYDFDLIHLQDFPFWRPFWFGSGDTKIVATVHFGIRRFIHPGEFGYFDRFYRTVLPRLFSKHLDGMITISEDSKHRHSEFFGINEERIFVTHNAPPEGFEPCPETGVLAKYGLDRPYAFHLSNKNFYKNPKGIMKGYLKAVREYDVEHDLVLAGGGWNEVDFSKHVESSAILERVHFLGRLPRADLPALYTHSDFVFLPSLSEGFPFVLLEAIACGTPVLTTSHFGMPELLGEAGTYISDVTNYDEVAEKFFEATTASDSGKKALEQSKKYSWEKTARETIETYKTVCGTHRG